MQHLIDMFKTNQAFLKDKRVLIVDDEADFASRNYRTVRRQALTDADGFSIEQKSEVELAMINQQIDEFRKKTATLAGTTRRSIGPYCSHRRTLPL